MTLGGLPKTRELTRTTSSPGPAPAGAGGLEAPLGESDPQSVRDGPAGVSSLWSRDARHRLHHGAESHQGPSPSLSLLRATPETLLTAFYGCRSFFYGCRRRGNQP